MFTKLLFVFVVVWASSGLSRHVPHYEDLDEEDQLLFRAAYDTTPYEHQDYQEEDEESVGKLDLLKDGIWAIKAKVKEMKTFNKALAANLLATKLQVKELLANHLKTLKKPHYIEIEKKKPVYSYQSPPLPSYPHYEPPHYSAPAPPAHQYEPHQYVATQPQYATPQYVPTQTQYGTPQYVPTQTQYGTPQYVPPQTSYGAPEYTPPQPQYGANQYSHDPYYGH